MANDRLYIQCSKCGETTLVATYWGAFDFHRPDFKAGDPRLGWEPTFDFLNKHGLECLDIGHTLGLDGGGFRLATEKDLCQPR